MEKRLNVRLDAELLEQFSRRATAAGMSQSEATREAIEQWVPGGSARQTDPEPQGATLAMLHAIQETLDNMPGVIADMLTQGEAQMPRHTRQTPAPKPQASGNPSTAADIADLPMSQSGRTFAAPKGGRLRQYYPQ